MLDTMGSLECLTTVTECIFNYFYLAILSRALQVKLGLVNLFTFMNIRIKGVFLNSLVWLLCFFFKLVLLYFIV